MRLHGYSFSDIFRKQFHSKPISPSFTTFLPALPKCSLSIRELCCGTGCLSQVVIAVRRLYAHGASVPVEPERAGKDEPEHRDCESCRAT